MKRLPMAVLTLLASGLVLLVLVQLTSGGGEPAPAAQANVTTQVVTSGQWSLTTEAKTPVSGGDSTGITTSAVMSGSTPAPTPAPVASSTPTTPDQAQNPVTVAVGPAVELTAAPPAPRLKPEPADYTDPLAVSRAYLAVWCHQRLDGPANQNVADAAAWATRLGFEFDSSTALTDQAWQDLVAGGLTPTCGPVTAVVSPDAPVGDNWVWVQMTTRRAWLDDSGRIIGQDNVSRTRRVVQAPDGRWLVDAQVQAG